MEGVRFGYNPDREILCGLNLALRSGTKTVLVGRSGSGKSTVAQLIARLADVQEGSVRIDSIDIRSIKLSSLRRSVAVVPQDPVLFDCSLRENLLMGNPKATRPELDKVIEMTQLTRLVSRLSSGLHEPVGARGGKLSGGERQRVALARALLQNPRVLILDEITAALDAATESALLKSLDEFARGRTVLVISHRHSTISWADRRLVLKNGRISEGDQQESGMARMESSLIGPAYQAGTELESVAL